MDPDRPRKERGPAFAGEGRVGKREERRRQATRHIAAGLLARKPVGKDEVARGKSARWLKSGVGANEAEHARG